MIVMDQPHLEGYEWGCRIGGGSFSSVYKAMMGNVVVAIKCINRCGSKRNTTDVAVREIALLKRCNHKNIVRLHDFQFDSKNIYIMMEFCTEGDLSTLLKIKRKLCESFIQILMQQLAAALRYLRIQDVCHMDLKPQNILLTRSPELVLKLGDFGLSCTLRNENLDLIRRAGSFRYMAPEKILNQKYDSRIDLWAAGVVMYECLVGRTLFGSAPLTAIKEHMTQRIPFDMPSCVSISGSCENMLYRLLKYDPDERIGFEEFFDHDWLKLNYLPCPENYARVTALVNEATCFEQEKNFPEALNKCKEAIFYLEGFAYTEGDIEEQKLVNHKLVEYKRWQGHLCYLVEQTCQGAFNTPVVTADTQYEALYGLCTATPDIKNALDIGRVAEMYVLDGKKEIALEKITTALDILIPLISTEPFGPRQELLHKQIQQWLLLGETLKRSI